MNPYRTEYDAEADAARANHEEADAAERADRDWKEQEPVVKTYIVQGWREWRCFDTVIQEIEAASEEEAIALVSQMLENRKVDWKVSDGLEAFEIETTFEAIKLKS